MNKKEMELLHGQKRHPQCVNSFHALCDAIITFVHFKLRNPAFHTHNVFAFREIVAVNTKYCPIKRTALTDSL